MIVGANSGILGEKKIGLNEESNTADDRQSIAEARNDPAAFVRLYRQHYDAVFRYCAHRLFEREAAEDVTSAVFLKVIENLSRFKGTEVQFRNWLYKIATNAVNDHLRQAARRKGLLRTVGEQVRNTNTDCGGVGDENAERLAVLREAMLTLRPRHQTIITLRFFENLKLTEIGEALGSKPGTVRSQLARALAELRKNIGPALQEV